MRYALAVLFAIAAIPMHAASAAPSHPHNAQGFVTDGSPQDGDQWCVGNTRQRVACLVARRPECPGHTMDRQTAMACWAPEINVYDWNHDGMFDALMCESRGYTGATNGRYLGLLQSDSGSYDPVQAFEDAYWVKWVGAGGPSPWAQTYGRWCA